MFKIVEGKAETLGAYLDELGAFHLPCHQLDFRSHVHAYRLDQALYHMSHRYRWESDLLSPFRFQLTFRGPIVSLEGIQTYA
jgi:hypothetical protein